MISLLEKKGKNLVKIILPFFVGAVLLFCFSASSSYTFLFFFSSPTRASRKFSPATFILCIREANFRKNVALKIQPKRKSARILIRARLFSLTRLCCAQLSTSYSIRRLLYYKGIKSFSLFFFSSFGCKNTPIFHFHVGFSIMCLRIMVIICTLLGTWLAASLAAFRKVCEVSLICVIAVGNLLVPLYMRLKTEEILWSKLLIWNIIAGCSFHVELPSNLTRVEK